MTTATMQHPNPRSGARPASRPSFLGAVIDPGTWKATLHLLLDLPVGIAGFTLVVTGVSLSLGLIPLALVGIPLLALTLLLARGLGAVERARAAALLDTDVEAPAPLRWQGGWAKVLKARLTDLVAWRISGYLLLMLPVGILTFTAAVTAWSIALGFLSYPLWAWSLPEPAQFGPGWYVDAPWEIAVTALVGLLLTPVAAWVCRGFGALDAALVRALLGPVSLGRRVHDLEERRDAAVDAAAAERRRIERDLHDGAQVRLTALAMELGMARDALTEGADPQSAAALVANAHEQAKAALTEVRDLARGIHPAILTDRGLEAALSSLAGRSVLPVGLDVDPRPSPAVEAIAYYVVAEALTNATRHAGASAARVVVRREGQRGEHLTVTVADDGRGGADPARGTGLAGLAERVRAVDGTFHIDSPEGGQTIISARIPCG
jgi:signal transduction histidine kinase